MQVLQRRIWQAPMAGTATPALAAAVCAAGGVGALGLGAMTPAEAARAAAQAQARGADALNLNLFCHAAPSRDAAREAAWLARLAPAFSALNAPAPAGLRDIYPTFRDSPAMLAAVIAARPAVVSFHFGLPRPDQIAALKATGAVLVATATSLTEARAARAAGIDALVAQGWQAGGHRGIFDENGPDERLETLPLLARLRGVGLPLIAAGGIMTAGDLRAALDAGAVAVQAGTAYLNSPEAATPPAHRAALAQGQTVMTRAISGRPARCLVNRFTALGDSGAAPYPLAYDAGKALIAAAQAAGVAGYGAHWAGTGAAQAEARPAAEITRRLAG